MWHMAYGLWFVEEPRPVLRQAQHERIRTLISNDFLRSPFDVAQDMLVEGCLSIFQRAPKACGNTRLCHYPTATRRAGRRIKRSSLSCVVNARSRSRLQRRPNLLSSDARRGRDRRNA
jgi:hypothetical protein